MEEQVSGIYNSRLSSAMGPRNSRASALGKFSTLPSRLLLDNSLSGTASAETRPRRIGRSFTCTWTKRRFTRIRIWVSLAPSLSSFVHGTNSGNINENRWMHLMERRSLRSCKRWPRHPCQVEERESWRGAEGFRVGVGSFLRRWIRLANRYVFLPLSRKDFEVHCSDTRLV